MKNLSVKQLVMLGLGVVVVVFVASYARMLIGGPTKGPGNHPPPAPPQQLTFTSQEWPEALDATSPEYEVHEPGNHAFWFRNDDAKPVQVSLISKTCKCTKVEICTLPPEMAAYSREELDRRADTAALDWKAVEKVEEGKSSTVPPHSAGGVRLNWKGEAVGPKALAADLHTESGGIVGENLRLEVRVNFVPALRVTTENDLKLDPAAKEISLGTLEGRGSRSITFLCWSSTRKAFDLRVEPQHPDPCVKVGKPEELSEQDCQRLGKRDGVRVLCAYRVPVTVHEQTPDGQQLDLGRFSRFFTFRAANKDDIEPASFGVSGMVRGDITVQGRNDRGKIISDVVALGSFERSEGKETDVTLTTEKAGLDLEVESHPDFLKVELQEDKGAELIGKAWTMHVAVPPDGDLVGVIPHGTDIVLKTKGDKPRRIRIPVAGNAYVK